MKQGQFSQEAEKGDKLIVELCRDKGISEAIFYACRKKFGGLQTRDVQRSAGTGEGECPIETVAG